MPGNERQDFSWALHGGRGKDWQVRVCGEKEGEVRQELSRSPWDSGNSRVAASYSSPHSSIPLSHSQVHLGLGRW